MDEAVAVGGWYAEARRRATAASRRRAADAASTDWPELAPPVALSPGPLGVVQAADREIAWLTAARARAVAAFAATRPATVDRAPGEPGAMSPERWAARPEVLRGVSEWATAELAVALAVSEPAAQALLERSLLLVGRLPGVLAALEAGALHPGHLWCLLEHVAPIADATVRAEVEAGLLRWAAGRVVTPAQLAARARREVLERTARTAARQLRRAIAERGVFLRPERVEGMAAVTAVLTLPEAQALYRTLHALADTLDDQPADAPGEPEPGAVRTRGQKLADVLLDLVLRPGEGDRPPVQVLLTVVASMATLLGGDTPGELDGHPVPAEMVRHLLQTLTGQPLTDPIGDGEPAPADVDPAGVGAAPVEDGGWDEDAPVVRAASDAWWAEWEARLLAGELDGPDPIPEDVLGGWAADTVPDPVDTEPVDVDALVDPEADRVAAKADLVDSFDHLVDPEPAAPQNAGEDPTEAPPHDPTGASLPRATGEEGRWWASADRAVEDASTAVQRAVLALGHARRLVHTAEVADAADETRWRAGPAGRVSTARTAVEALAAATAVQRDRLAALLAATGGGGLAERPRIALTDALSGTLLAVSDLPGLRRTAHCSRPGCRRRPHTCRHDLTGRPGLGPPPPTDDYRPGAELDRWVRARDRRCRFPGCRRRVPKGGELDHQIPWPAGPTSADNLAGFCTGHHRGKHQAPGWTTTLTPDGTLTVTTPTGLTTTTQPPPY